MATTGSSSNIATADRDAAAVDLVVGLAVDGLSNRDTSRVLRHVAGRLRKGGPTRWRIVMASSSPQGDVSRIASAAGPDADVGEVAYSLQPSDALDQPYHGVVGRARCLHALVADAQRTGTRALIVVDPRSAGPDGLVSPLAAPLLAGTADYVTPVYSRHPVAGALVRGLLYPMFRALYGADVRFPIWTDVGCSARLIDAVAADPVWDTGPGQIGIDLWLSSTAATTGMRLAQVWTPPPADERPGIDLGSTISQLVGYFFTDMERRVSFWQRARTSRPAPPSGTTTPGPPPRGIDAATVADAFRLGSQELQDVWAEVLPPAAILQWRRLAAAPLDAFRVDDALWARTVYDFAVGHRQRVIARDHLLRALTPLYLGWLTSFILQAGHAPEADGHASIERLCLAFEAEKPYLISQWRWPERFRPVKMRR